MKIIFFGRPGSGKGTYASRIAPQLGIVHIATGDMFRAEVAAGTPLGKLAEKYMKNGELVPDDVTINMFKERLEKAKKGFILDGFPRNLEQSHALEKMAKIDLVVNFVIDEDIIIEKALTRRICEKCGNIYNIADIKRGNIRLPPLLPKKEGICDKCGGKLYQRKDDNYETIKDRQDTYVRQSEPLLKYYRQKGMVKDVSVIGGPEQMVPIIIDVIKKNVK
ncbi:MAG: nucleoside monophosphate kinase [Candidatus Aenigmatarchaeota archaeon]